MGQIGSGGRGVSIVENLERDPATVDPAAAVDVVEVRVGGVGDGLVRGRGTRQGGGVAKQDRVVGAAQIGLWARSRTSPARSPCEEQTSPRGRGPDQMRSLDPR